MSEDKDGSVHVHEHPPDSSYSDGNGADPLISSSQRSDKSDDGFNHNRGEIVTNGLNSSCYPNIGVESTLQKLEKTLKLNRDYQQTVREQLKAVELAIAKNQELQRRLRIEINQRALHNSSNSYSTHGSKSRSGSKSRAGLSSSTSATSSASPLLLSSSSSSSSSNAASATTAMTAATNQHYTPIAHLVDRDGRRMPDNPDTVLKSHKYQKVPINFDVKKWSKTELMSLNTGVQYRIQEYLATKLMDQCQLRYSGDALYEEYRKGSSSFALFFLTYFILYQRSSADVMIIATNRDGQAEPTDSRRL